MWKKFIYLTSFIFVLSMVLAGPADAVDPNLMLWLEFEDDINDSSDYARPTDYNDIDGNPTDYVDGIFSRAIDLEGDDSIWVTGWKGITGTSAFTIAAWIRSTDVAGTLVGWGTGRGNDTEEVQYRTVNNNGGKFRIDNGDGHMRSKTNTNDDEWHHIAVTVKKNGTMSLSDVVLYTDGFDDTSSTTGTIDDSAFNSIPSFDVRIGDEYNREGGWRWAGDIDDLRIYDYELSADEIRMLAGALAPFLDSPADEATLTKDYTWLEWTPGVYAADVNGHEVYLSDSPEDVNAGAGGALFATLSGSSDQKLASGLDTGKVYYWKVDAVNDTQPPGRWSSEVRSFTVPDVNAWEPYPPDKQKFVDLNVTLEWQPGMGSQGSVVYFGPNFADVNSATGGTAQPGTTYSPGPLVKDTDYYWRIDTVSGTTVKGPVWSFRTYPHTDKTDPNLVGWWKLDDEDSGVIAVAVDDSGYDHYGRLYNGAGYSDQAVQFDGIDDYVSIDQGDGYKGVSGTHAFSIAAWIKTVDPSVNINDQSNIVCWGTHSGGQRVEFRIQGSRLRVSHGIGNVQGDTTVNDAEWHHVVMTVIDNAELSSSDVRVYVDGFDDTRPSTDEDTFNIAADADLGIGYQATQDDRFFAGLIDEVRLYDYVLSPGEVVQLVYPGMAYNPSPIDRAPAVPRSAKLTWTPATDESTDNPYTKHDLYFSTNFEDVNAGTVTPIRIDGPNEYDPNLDYYNYYYWRIDEVNDSEEPVRGFVWSFKVTYDPNLFLDPNLVGHWKLDDVDSGVMAVDDSGYGHLGTLHNGAGYVAGYTDQAVQFDGIDDYVSIDQGGQVEGYKGVLGPNAFSVAAWIKTVDPAVNDNQNSNIVCWGTDSGGERVEFRIQGSRLRVDFGNGNVQGDTTVNDGEWHHVATTVGSGGVISSSNIGVYVDGFDDTRTSSDPDTFDIVADADLGIGYRATHGDRFFEGLIDEVRLYNRVLSPDEVIQLMYPGRAYNPSPIDGARDVPLSAKLTWTPSTDESTGSPYTKHDVYFSADFDDVNDGTVARIRIKDANEYTPTLDYINYVKSNYYWRVDEVNDSNEAVPGFVWSFRTTHDPNLVDDPNLLAWYKFDDDNGDGIAEDSSGYGNDLTEFGEPAYTAGFEDQAINLDGIDDYAVYSFPTEDKNDYTVTAWVRVDTLGQNGNSSVFSSHTPNNAGFQLDVDGTNPGNYRYNNSFDKLLGPVTTGWVHLAVTSNGAFTRTYYNGSYVDSNSLSDLMFNRYAVGINRADNNWFDGAVDEVRIYKRMLSEEEIKAVMRIDLARAWMPNPGDGATGVAREPTLSWNPGKHAQDPNEYMHMVYFGADDPCNMVLVSTPAQPQTPNNFDVTTIPAYAGGLDLDRTYYWVVDEVNVAAPGGVNPGKIWSFTVVNYLVVDDMESYPGAGGGSSDPYMWEVWLDGAGDCPGTNNTNSGSILYADDVNTAPGGSTASMRYVYDNDGTVEIHPCGGGPLIRPWYSKGVAQLADLPSGIDPNWLTGGAKALSLQFNGEPNNTIELLWVELEDGSTNRAKVFYGAYDDEDPNDFNDGAWHEWSIALDDFTGVDESNVKSITIGIGDEGATSAGETGILYVDDIRLYTSRCLPGRLSADFSKFDYAPTGPGGDCVIDAEELDVMFGDWLDYDSTVSATTLPDEANLVGHWQFEGNFNDSSVNGHDGDPCGFVTTVYDADRGSDVLSLDGFDDYVNITGYKGILGPNAFSLAAWINTTRADIQWNCIIGWGSTAAGTQFNFRLSDESTQEVPFSVRTAQGNGNVQGYTPLNDGEWHHVAATLASGGICSSSYIRIYVDGRDDTRKSTDPDIRNIGSGADVGIGLRASHGDRHFEGLIDDVRIYDYALSQGEVLSIVGIPEAYNELKSVANVYDEEPENSKIVNFLDYAVLVERWLDEELWP